jgi:hypothetical protein
MLRIVIPIPILLRTHIAQIRFLFRSGGEMATSDMEMMKCEEGAESPDGGDADSFANSSSDEADSCDQCDDDDGDPDEDRKEQQNIETPSRRKALKKASL